jgi:hypothetical protein
MDESSFIRYLASKKTVDDRALNRRVWEAMLSRVNGTSPRVLELGGGIGTMIERAAAEPGLRPGSWTMVDAQQAVVDEARRRLANQVPFATDLVCADVEEFLQRRNGGFDLVVAHAFLDLLDPVLILPTLLGCARPGATFLFSVTFDGLTAWEPEIDAELDKRVVDLYHGTMDGRIVNGRPSGDSRCGRHLLSLLPRCGYRLLEAGSSDWVVYPRDGGYPADESFFLSCVLGFFEESLNGHPGLGPGELSAWLGARRKQLAGGELILVAHQLDVCASPR